MSRPRITNEDVCRILDDAATRLDEEGSPEFKRDALILECARDLVRTLPESYVEPSGEMDDYVSGHQPTLDEQFVEHLTEAVRISDGLTEGWHNHVLARKLRTYEGHPYLVIIHDLGDLATGD